MTPTARTLKQLRDEGWTAQVVERRIPFNHTTIDFLGCIDVLAVRPDRGILGVQCTADNGGHVANRVAKSLAEPRLTTWLASGGKFEVWGWGKRGGVGARKLWTLRRQGIVLSHGELVVVIVHTPAEVGRGNA